jgi:hypothetical protein
MSALGQKQTFALRNDMSALPPKAVEIANIAGADGGQSISALPSTSNIDLLRYGESVVHIDAEIPHSALCDQAEAGRRADSRCAGKSALPSFAAVSVCPYK